MWTKSVFQSVYSRIVSNGRIRIKSAYPTLNPNFAKDIPSAEKIKYPCIVVKKLQGKEVARDIEARFINGIISNIQIEVFSNKKQDESDDIAEIIADLMKSMSYEMIGDPIPMDGLLNDYRTVARYTREIDYQDII